MSDSGEHDTLKLQFMELTQASPEEAGAFLESVSWDLDAAVDAFFSAADTGNPSAAFHSSASQGPEDFDKDFDEEETSIPASTFASSTGGHILGGGASSMSQDKSKHPGESSGRVRTLADLNNDNGPSGSPFGSRSPSAQPGSDDEGSSFGNAFRRRQPEDLFTGGEKSGLAVQNPDSDRHRLVRDLLRRAELGGQEEPPARAQPTQSRFTGAGHVLGSDIVESRTIADSSSNTAQPDASPVTRTLTFWRDGFSVENGALLRYDDPANQEILRAINSGRAPLHLLNVNPGQHVDVRVERRMTEDYVSPNPSKGGFYGSGHRLGS
ncbi:hypothetical protein V1507DRAFT_468674 [Lipomyces tetrasporus]